MNSVFITATEVLTIPPSMIPEAIWGHAFLPMSGIVIPWQLITVAHGCLHTDIQFLSIDQQNLTLLHFSAVSHIQQDLEAHETINLSQHHCYHNRNGKYP